MISDFGFQFSDRINRINRIFCLLAGGNQTNSHRLRRRVSFCSRGNYLIQIQYLARLPAGANDLVNPVDPV